jgi:hypothetical protein
MPLSSVLGAQSLIKPGVCTSSTRPASPFDGQVIYETDTNRTLVFNGSTWDIISVGVFTSSTRPSGAYEGQLIYETDTDLVKSYNGTSWFTVGPTTQAISAIDQALVTTNQTTTSTSYTDLATAGPTVTLTTGTSALCIWGARYDDDTNAGADGYMSVAVSGASTVSASDSYAAYGFQGFGGSNQLPLSFSYKFTGLTAGSNTFTAKYKRSGGTAAGFSYRWLIVIAI